MSRACLDRAELSRVAHEGATADVTAHLRACATCARELDELASLIALANELPWDPPAPAQIEELRTSVLAAAKGLTPRPRVRRARLYLAASALAIAAAAVAIVGSLGVRRRALAVDFVAPPPASIDRALAHHGEVTPGHDARFALAGAAPDEIVRLEEGTIALSVSPLDAGERFRVVTGDAEVEVRGTSFEVTAKDDRLIGVRVQHGTVVVRPTHGVLATLEAGQTWSAPRADEPPPSPAPAPSPTIAPPPSTPAKHVAAPAPNPTGPSTSPADAAFDDGWDALRRGDPVRAAVAFRRAVEIAPTAPIADDAGFWLAVSLARAGEPAEARQAFAAYLDAHPTSNRAGEASAMLGWLLVDAGDLDGAEARFTRAAKDPVKRVSDSAAAGLRAVAAKRGAE